MLVKLICLFTIAVLAVQGEIPESRIQSDAAEWTRLHKDYVNILPSRALVEDRQTTCHAMLECCPNERNNFFDLMQEDTFESKCFGDRSSTEPKCIGLIQQYDNIKNSTEYIQFMKAKSEKAEVSHHVNIRRKRLSKVCSREELEIYFCEPENYEKFQPCRENVLRSIARENDGQGYDAFIRQIQDDYSINMQVYSKVFPRKL